MTEALAGEQFNCMAIIFGFYNWPNLSLILGSVCSCYMNLSECIQMLSLLIKQLSQYNTFGLYICHVLGTTLSTL